VNLSQKLQFLEKCGFGFARTGNKFLTDRHYGPRPGGCRTTDLNHPDFDNLTTALIAY